MLLFIENCLLSPLLLGLPGESTGHHITSLQRVLELGVDGLKFHPLHVVKGTQLANEWRRGEYRPLTMDEYVSDVVELINHTPDEVIFHRLTGTASPSILLAPQWCSKKWQVLNAVTTVLAQQQRCMDASFSTLTMDRSNQYVQA